MTALQLIDVAVRRGGRRLFEALSVEVLAGEALALTGANGAGKTSLLRAIAGLLPLDAGQVRFGDIEPSEARASGLHFLSHQDGLKAGRTAGEELAFWTAWAGGSPAQAGEAADQLELGALLDLEVRRLSAGQRRRLALARLLSAPRPIWLLDEPASPLDARWRGRLGELMAAHLAGGGLIVAAVHDPLPVPAQILEIAA